MGTPYIEFQFCSKSILSQKRVFIISSAYRSCSGVALPISCPPHPLVQYNGFRCVQAILLHFSSLDSFCIKPSAGVALVFWNDCLDCRLVALQIGYNKQPGECWECHCQGRHLPRSQENVRRSSASLVRKQENTLSLQSPVSTEHIAGNAST